MPRNTNYGVMSTTQSIWPNPKAQRTMDVVSTDSAVFFYERRNSLVPSSNVVTSSREGRSSVSPTTRLLHRVSKTTIVRYTLGIFFLLVTVVLFTASNFLASTLFADNSYSKPFFVTYINSSFFSLFLLVSAIRWVGATRCFTLRNLAGNKLKIPYSPLAQDEVAQSSRSLGAHLPPDSNTENNMAKDILNVRETALLGFEFCLLWFLANYFVAAGLEFTTVASATVLTATSGIWTLMFGALLGVESFTSKKFLGVLATLCGVVMTSSIDISDDSDKNRGSFPHKTKREIAGGDALAFASAVMYGIYTTVLKKQVGNVERVNMSLFFGFVGLFTIFMLWPGIVILHITGIERFEIPPTQRIVAILLINSAISLVSDVCWAYSMLLTSPLVVTVGLSLTIPLSLVGQIVLNAQNPSILYWAGAGIVFLSFVFVNHESKKGTGI